MGFKYNQIYLVWLVELLDWKTISTDLHTNMISFDNLNVSHGVYIAVTVMNTCIAALACNLN